MSPMQVERQSSKRHHFDVTDKNTCSLLPFVSAVKVRKLSLLCPPLISEEMREVIYRTLCSNQADNRFCTRWRCASYWESPIADPEGISGTSCAWISDPHVLRILLRVGYGHLQARFLVIKQG